MDLVSRNNFIYAGVSYAELEKTWEMIHPATFSDLDTPIYTQTSRLESTILTTGTTWTLTWTRI